MNPIRWISHLKNLFLPDRTEYRRIKFGICKGCVMLINLRHDSRKLFGLYESEIQKFIHAYVHPGSCCYDLGANTGYYTLAMSRLASPGKVYAIDSELEFCDSLKKTLSLNRHLKSKTEVLHGAISQRLSEKKHEITVDYLVFEKGCTPPDVIKMDVEGSEYGVLLGAAQVIRRHSPKFIIETHSKELEEQCKALLESEKYECTIVKNNPFLPELRPMDHNRWLCAIKRN